MAFGPIIDVPILLAVFGFLQKFRDSIVNIIVKIKLPKLILAILFAIPLLILEENINCGAFNCAYSIWPPTIWFLIIMEFVYFLLINKFSNNNILHLTLYYGLWGIFFEFVFGIASTQLRLLLKSNPIIFILLMLWVGFSYVFVVYLPLVILKSPRQSSK